MIVKIEYILQNEQSHVSNYPNHDHIRHNINYNKMSKSMDDVLLREQNVFYSIN